MYNLDFLVTALVDVANEADNRNLQPIADELTSLILMLSKFGETNKQAYIEKIKEDGETKYEVKSPKNPNWSGGKFLTKEKAKKRLSEVEMFKHINQK